MHVLLVYNYSIPVHVQYICVRMYEAHIHIYAYVLYVHAHKETASALMIVQCVRFMRNEVFGMVLYAVH